MKNKNKSSDRGKVKEIVEDEETIRLKENIYVVFVECESPGNVGFLARTMGNFGLHKLVLINPCTLKDEAYYQAMHARETVENALVYDTVEDFVKDNEIDFIVGSTGAPGGSYNLSRIPIEGNGLTNAEIEMCDITVSIPTDPSYPIMNISHAAAVILYEIFKNRNNYPVEGLEESTALEKEYLLSDMEKLISTLSIPDHKKKNGLKVFKNIINRAFITGREAHTLKGILRRLNKKIEEENNEE